MKKLILAAIFFVLLVVPVLATAEPFDTPHRITFGVGYHSFFPEGDEEEGTRPDQDGFVTEQEWIYIYDQGYDISDYNGPTGEIGYEYLFVHWFGLATNLGYYGGQDSYDFRVEGIKAETDIMVGVFHIDVVPRFHWQTRWTDLYGGPVVGLYRANVNLDFEVSFLDFTGRDTEHDQDSALGWGLNLGFEFRISKTWGISLEDRLTSAVMFQDKDRTEWFNAGGNVLLLMAVVHL